jgi:DNA polymerase-3 subunit alpha
MRQAEQRQNDHLSGQSGLFSEAQGCQEYEEKYDSTPSFSFRKTLQLEKIVMGYYFYQHPTDKAPL